MRQLLLRVPDDLHHRLADRAAADGRSVNALATTILSAALDGPLTDRRQRLLARAAAAGLLRTPVPSIDRSGRVDRDEVVGANRGLGRFIDEALDDERSRP